MSVLTLAGKPINWSSPPAYTAKVMWSRTTTNGKAVTGSLRSIAHLDHLNTLSIKKFGKPIDVFQSAFNTGVALSKGTHDYDACYDVRILGVPWLTQQAFFRANGAGAYARVAGWPTAHIHYFTLPPVFASGTVAERYGKAGLKVGYLVDGGWTTQGRVIASSQIVDYYQHRDATSDHAIDSSWFPSDIDASVFDFNAYAKRQRPKTLALSLINIPDKVGLPDIRLCFDLALTKGRVVGVNEVFHPRQRALYEVVAKARGFGFYGLHKTPNVLFWKTDLFARRHAMVHQIHGRNTTAKNANQWPGFYDKREITEVVLRRRSDGKEFAFLLTHLAAEVKVVDQKWLRAVKRKSKRMLRDLTRKHMKAGRVVIVEGDMNTREDFSMPKTFRWYTKGIIDKVGGNRKGKSTLFAAPTDHGHGVRAVIQP